MIGAALVRKFLAKPIAGSKTLWNTVAATSASVAQTLLEAIKSTLAVDAEHLKKTFFKRLDVQTDVQAAEAQKKIAEAATAANRVIQRDHAEALARLERQGKEIENQKRQAEAGKLQAEAAAAGLRVMDGYVKLAKKFQEENLTNAKEALDAALAKLVREAGALYVDSRQLKRLSGEVGAKGGEDDEP